MQLRSTVQLAATNALDLEGLKVALFSANVIVNCLWISHA